jgi:restriction endonuclease Mrr
MPIPDYQSLMLPLLRFYADGSVHSFKEAETTLARELNLTEDELRQLIPSGRQPLFYNRVAWARTYMSKAGLLASAKRGQFSITKLGQKVLAQKPERIDVRFLKQFPSFVEFQDTKHTAAILRPQRRPQPNPARVRRSRLRPPTFNSNKPLPPNSSPGFVPPHRFSSNVSSSNSC